MDPHRNRDGPQARGPERDGPEQSGTAARCVHLKIGDEWDAAIARRHARHLARAAGLRESSAEALATAISEIVHNVVVHANHGEASLEVAEGGRGGVIVVVRDNGPGIADLTRAMQDGYSTVGSLGLGLPSARSLVDEFELASVPGQGTTVVLKKWR